MKIILEMDPPRTTAQEQKIAVVNGKPIIYKPHKLKTAREELLMRLKIEKLKTGFYTEKPVYLAVQWYFHGGKHKEFEWKATRPDTDNLNKMLKDCMTEAGFWRDDAQVVSEHIYKYWTPGPGIIVITVEDIDEAESEN